MVDLYGAIDFLSEGGNTDLIITDNYGNVLFDKNGLTENGKEIADYDLSTKRTKVIMDCENNDDLRKMIDLIRNGGFINLEIVDTKGVVLYDDDGLTAAFFERDKF